MIDHPTLKLFKRAVELGQVDRLKEWEFDRWRNGKKCPEGSELRAAADELWAHYESLGAPKAPPPGARTQRSGHRGSSGEAGRNAGAADPSCLGAPFHNPYTFLPFPKTAPERRKPTPLSIDEIEKERFTGIVELELETLSPLLSCSPVPASTDNGHATYEVLRIGEDVIVPATGVRGALRNLMTILAGGSLSYLDDEVWLCQGRDARLGPANPKRPDGSARNVFLAEVLDPGDATRKGKVRVGRAKLVRCRHAPVELRITDGLHETYQWTTVVGFISTHLRYSLLGHAGCLQFFDAQFRGADQEVVLTPNSSFPPASKRELVVSCQKS